MEVGRISAGVENAAAASGALLDAMPTLPTAQRHVLIDTDAPPGRWRALALIAIAQIGAMSTWFSAAAVAPSLVADWHLSTAQLGLLTAAVQLGFVAGALASSVTGAADVLSTRRVFMLSALAAAVVNALLVFAGGELVVAVILRFGLGFSLAGVYPTGIKLMTGWFRDGRGLAIGTLVGALTLGAALPRLVAGSGALGGFRWQAVISVTSMGALGSAAIAAWCVRPGPFQAPSGRLDLTWAVRSLKSRSILLANLGCFGHMWELYAMWTWLPAFLIASFAASAGQSESDLRQVASLVAGAAIGAGALGSIAAGRLADQLGRTTITGTAMAASGTTAVLTGLLFGQAPALVIAAAMVWGVTVVADSAQFSAALSELSDVERVGSALALQTAIGFLLTAISIQLLPLIQALIGWSGALAILAIGPALGVIAMLSLRARSESLRLAGGRR